MKSGATSVQEYWDKHSGLFRDYYRNPTWFDRIFRKAIFLRAMIAVDVCSNLPSPSVLDVGSGPGINSVALIKMGKASHVTGIDFSRAMIKLAENYAQSEAVAGLCRFIEGDFLKHDFAPKSFDLAAALGVFDYVGEPRPFLARMVSLSRRAVVASWPENGLRMKLRQLRYTCPVHPYTETQIRELHAQAGVQNLELVKIPGGWVSKAFLE